VNTSLDGAKTVYGVSSVGLLNRSSIFGLGLPTGPVAFSNAANVVKFGCAAICEMMVLSMTEARVELAKIADTIILTCSLALNVALTLRLIFYQIDFILEL
jgi:hypothetical protein